MAPRSTRTKTPPIDAASTVTTPKTPAKRASTKTLAERKTQNAADVLRAYTASTSREVERVNQVLTAAAEILEPGASPGDYGGRPNAATRTWQHAAWGYGRSVPELGAAQMFVGNCLSQIQLAVGKRSPDGSTEMGFDGDEPVEGLDSKLANQAAELISQIRGPTGGQSEVLRSFGEKVFVIGECYVVPEQLPSGKVFQVMSTQELMPEGNEWVYYPGPGFKTRPLAEGTTPIRVWRRDGQYGMIATSSVQSSLEVLEELVVLTRLVRASAISRMAVAGILLLPDELDFPEEEAGPDGNMSEARNPVAVDIINNGSKAIDDPASAAAWMPFVLQAPGEILQHVRHVPFQTDDQENVIKRTEALQRLAQGLDLPVEIVMGHQCVDHQTEILTTRGWLSNDEVQAGDTALTLNHETGASEWQPVDAVHHYNVVDERMLSIERRSHSSLTTANHRWPVISHGWGKRRWKTSETLSTDTDIICAAPHQTFDPEPKWSDDLVELVAWYYTEGTDIRAGSAVIYQSMKANPVHVARIRATLTSLVGPPTESMHDASRSRAQCTFPGCEWLVHSHGLCDAHRAQRIQGIPLRPVRRTTDPPAPKEAVPAWRESAPNDRGMVLFHLNKTLADHVRVLAPAKVPSGEFIRSLSKAQLELFIERSVDGDGCRIGDGDSIQFHQADQRRTDAFELACVLAGRAVTRRTGISTGGFKDSVRHQVVTRSNDVVSIRPGREWVTYTGQVWCPTTGNGTWLARRKGTVYFTGNSTTFANAAQVSQDTFNLHIKPTIQLFCDALTITYLWPAIAIARGITPETIAVSGYPADILTVGVTFDASKLISRPDRAKDIIDLYIHDMTFSAVKISEAREAVGLDPDGGPDDDEISKRVDAYRLGRIREVIAGPVDDAAVPIQDASAGKAVVPGQSAGSKLIGQEAPSASTSGAESEAVVDKTAIQDAEDSSTSVRTSTPLAERIAGAAEIVAERAVERVGAKLRSKSRGNAFSEAERAACSGVANAKLPRVLGREIVERIVGNTDELMLAELKHLAKKIEEWATADDHPDPPAVVSEAACIAIEAARAWLYADPEPIDPARFSTLEQASV